MRSVMFSKSALGWTTIPAGMLRTLCLVLLAHPFALGADQPAPANKPVLQALEQEVLNGQSLTRFAAAGRLLKADPARIPELVPKMLEQARSMKATTSYAHQAIDPVADEA